MSNTPILAKIFKNIIVDPNITEIPHNPSQEVQSAVTVIFKRKNEPHSNHSSNYLDHSNSFLRSTQDRIQQILDTEVLLLERSPTGKAFSGDICLPGGKVQPGETPLQAAIRETYEETGIKLESELLIGLIDRKFVAHRLNNKLMVTFLYLFQLTNSQEVHLNQAEMKDFRWVRLGHFLEQNSYKKLRITKMQKWLAQISSCENQIEGIEVNAIDVGLGKELYGFTLYLLGYLSSPIVSVLVQRYWSLLSLLQKKGPECLGKQGFSCQQLIEVKNSWQRCLMYGLRFKNLYFDQARVIFKGTCVLSERNRQNLEQAILKFLKAALPERPKF